MVNVWAQTLIQCANCQIRVHKRCSGVKDNLCKASLSCIQCVFMSDSEVKSCADIDDGSSAETVPEFYCLWEMLSVDAVTARIPTGWF